MKVNGKTVRTIRLDRELRRVFVIDQRLLPHQLIEVELSSWQQVRDAIAQMVVRGAPLIGVSAAAGIALACNEISTHEELVFVCQEMRATRPTAVNLAWAVTRMEKKLLSTPPDKRLQMAWDEAEAILEEDLSMSRAIARNAGQIIQDKFKELNRPVNILTHCNAGWLATVDWGTALAGIYQAYNQGIPVHVFADETRPRMQGALTVWELGCHGVDCTLIVDNAGGHLMQQGLVDLVITGADRIAANGDSANKIGTYLKALAAFDNQIPFYIAAPWSTFDWSIENGRLIEIEERDGDEVRQVAGLSPLEKVSTVAITSCLQKVCNPGFDVTPSRLITGIITERGVFAPENLNLFRKQGGKGD